MATQNDAPDWVTQAVAGLPPLCSAKEAADLLRTTKRNVYRLTAIGRIHALRPAERGSSRLLIPRSSLERYLRSLDGQAA